MENQRKYKKYARGSEPEMQGYYAGFEEFKDNWRERQSDEDNTRVAFNERTPEDLEKERKLNQALSFLPQERKKEEIKRVMEHSNNPETRFENFSVDTSSLMVMLAENFQRTESGISPQAEYYVWRDVTDKLIVDLNTDGASVEEVHARGSFIDFLENREAEMKMVMSLYYFASVNGKGYYQELAKTQLNFMTFKLSELRRFKAKMQASPSMANAEELQKQKEANVQKIYHSDVNTVELAARSIGGKAVQLGAAEALRRHVNDRIIGNEMERGVAEHFVRFRPETHSREEAEAKIIQLSDRQLIEYMRRGLSREEAEQALLKERLKTEQTNFTPNSRFLAVYRQKQLQNAG